MMQYPSEIQCALLLQQPIRNLEKIVRTFMSIIEAKEGFRFNVPESNPGLFYRLFAVGDLGREMMVTFELIPNPGDPAVFQQALGSAITGKMCPDVRQRLMRHRAMILVNVSQGVFGSVMQDPKLASFLSSVGVGQEGANLPMFQRRLSLCQLAARIAADETQPLLVHWTQSNQLLPGEIFDGYASADAPHALHIHPWLFGPQAMPGEKQKLGIRTFGARHFIGREIVIEPHELPFTANYETILAFLGVATASNGYIIPDGDTFGPEDRSLSYRVTWHDAEEGDVPTYALTPLFYREYGFVSEDHAPAENVIDERMPPAAIMPEDDEAKMELVNEWAEKRALAENMGGRFEVRSFQTPPPGTIDNRPVMPMIARPPITGSGLRTKIFGRKGQ